MKRMKRALQLSFAGMASIVLLASCSGNGGKSENTANGSEEIKTKEPVELVIYNTNGTWTEEQFQAVFIEPLKKKYPYIQAKFIAYDSKDKQQLSAMVATKQIPDLFISTPGPGFETNVRQYELQYDLTPLIAQNKYDLGKLDPTAVDVVRSMSNGALYSLPLYMSPNTIYYNKDVFDKFGVSYPKDGMTWDDVYELSKRLTRNEGGVQYRGFLLSYVHLMQLNQVSQRLFDPSMEKVAFDTSELKGYLQHVFRIFELPGYAMDKISLETGGQNDMFIKEKTVAMIEPGGTLYDKSRIEPLGNNWDFTYFPVLKEKPGVGYQPYPFVISMASTSEHKEAAFEAMTYFTSDEFQRNSTRAGAFLPVLKDRSVVKTFGQDSDLYKGKHVEALLPKTFANVPVDGYSEYAALAKNQLYNAYKNVVTGKKDMNTAFREAVEAAEKSVAAAKATKANK